jgi:spore coat protein CotF
MNLTQKERMLLEDQKKHEKICIEKYSSYAQQAQDPQLKQLFNSYAAVEQQHWDTINHILQGQMPTVGQQGQGMQQQGMGQGQQSQAMQKQPGFIQSQGQAGQGSSVQGPGTMQGVMANQQDADLCNDMLMTEKYISGTYDTAIFEFTDANLRQVLNHIQKEEQEHGEGIFNYMQSKGMYNPQ